MRQSSGQTALGTLALGILVLAGTGAPAAAESVADFYKHKRITMYIGYSAGGGYDRYARTVARHMSRHIPGKPGFTAKNYTGAGGMRLANTMYTVFKQDGTIMGILGRQLPLEHLTGNPKVKFNANKFHWIGSANQEYSVCAFWHTSPIKTTDDLFNKVPIVGGTGAGSGTDTQAMMLNNLIGAKLRLITGYPGGADINLAMERGELHGRCAWSWSSVTSTKAEWLKDKKVVFPLQIARKKHKALQHVPLVGEFIKNDLDRQALDVVLAGLVIGRPFVVGPKVPADRVKALRAAFMATMSDAEFLAEAKKGRMPIDAVGGEEVQELLAGLYKLSPEVIKRAGEAISSKNNIEISQAVIKTNVYKGEITKVARGGRRVSWKTESQKGRLRVGGKTKIAVAGKKAKRDALKAGMSCTFSIKGAETALKIDCN
jgi:tripartite-type tricarboxylate transporter receptor subunit TctC